MSSSDEDWERYTGYQPVPTIDMDEYFKDENKFVPLPWEDNM